MYVSMFVCTSTVKPQFLDVFHLEQFSSHPSCSQKKMSQLWNRTWVLNPTTLSH